MSGMYATRLARLRQAVRDLGCDGAVLLASGRHQMLVLAPSNFLAGFLPLGDAALVVPPSEGEPVRLLVNPAWDAGRARSAPGASEVALAVEGTDGDIVTALLATLRGYRGTWALVGADRFPFSDVQRLLAPVAAPVVWRRADRLLADVAAAKDQGELAQVRAAARIADVGFEALYAAAEPGVAEYDLVAEMDYAMRRMGAEDNFGLVASGDPFGPSRLQAIRVASGRVLQPGDVIIAEITPVSGGYFAQLCRTIVLGEAPAPLRRAYGLLQSSFAAGLAATQPGRPVSAAAEAIDEPFRAAGYEMYTRPPYMRVRGHGLGMGSPAPGNVSATNDTPFAPGMTLILHPNQFLPDTGYLMLGETVEVTPDGARGLSAVVRRLHEKAV